jgi:SAM-dependent methyltransferase
VPPPPAGAIATASDDVRTTIARAAANYSTSADGYAEFWSPVIRPVGRRLLDALPWDRARWILDVGTGTGALIPDLLQRAPSARVVGIDPSLGMLDRARRVRMPLAAMDAMALGLRAGTFDVAVLAFVLFHVPDPPAALSEVRRALRHPGSIGLTTWAEEPATPAIRIWDEELDTDGAWDPSPHSTQATLMDSPEKVRDLLDAAGFAPGGVWLERVEYQWSVPRFMGLRTGFGTTKRRLETLDPATRQACLDRIAARLARLGTADFVCRGTAVCATAAA